MWDEFDIEDDGWQPVRTRRAGTIRLVAILVVAAMVIALIIPVVLRLMRNDGADVEPDDGVRAVAVAEHKDPATVRSFT